MISQGAVVTGPQGLRPIAWGLVKADGSIISSGGIASTSYSVGVLTVNLSVAQPTKYHYLVRVINNLQFEYQIRVSSKTTSSFQLKTWSISGASYVNGFIDENHFEVFAL